MDGAAAAGDPQAIIAVANDLRFGIMGRSEDKVRAKQLLESLAKEGNTEAQLKLGDMYYFGEIGEQKDKKQSCFWYKKAAAGGSPEAASKIKRHCQGKADTPDS